MYFHQGTPYRYSAWRPVTINGTAPFAKPLYYGNLFAATAFAGEEKKVVSLINETSLAAYAIYGRCSASANHEEQGTLESVAIVNLNMHKVSQSAESREAIAFLLPDEAEVWSNARVSKLTAPGVGSKGNVTFAGQYVDADGRIVGEKVMEVVKNGTVIVGDGEAVLISLP
jgi:hypothetical protein